MKTRIGGRERTILAAVLLAASLIVAAGSTAHAAYPAQQPPRFFQETGFGIDDPFFSYFQSRGGVPVFGFPVSRVFRLQGHQVQIFQRGVMQRAPDGSVRLLNLLDEGLMPVASINASRFPAPDPGMVAATPAVGSPDYGPRMAEFVLANVPDEFDGLPVRFQQTFLQTVPSPGMDPGGLALLNLEIWGAPTSPPARDPGNRNFVYQRFQRGIMHFDASTGTTQGLLLGDWFKSVLTGQGLPPDLEQQMANSPYLRQYRNGGTSGTSLPDSDLAGAFEPQQPQAAPETGRALLFPDLRTLPPEDVSLDTEPVDGVSHQVLRFGNTVWNAGEGPLEIRAVTEGEGSVVQRIFDAEGGSVDRSSGTFVFHAEHSHWHLEGYARYELWSRSAFDAWQASDRTQGGPEWLSDKVGFCLMDTYRVADLPGSPSSVAYPALCGHTVQGISVGWGDVYSAQLAGQGIDLGPDPLPDGQYVLRSVADPLNVIQESEGGTDPSRESEEANESVVILAVEAGRVVGVAR
ncbi:MAG: lysyl oxidase family protein [Sphingomonadaceae bacterium]